MLEEMEQLLKKHGLSDDFIERVLKLQYLDARERILSSNDPSLLQFDQEFAGISQYQNLGYSSCLGNLILSGSSDSSGHSFFDLQDSASHISSLFEKHHLAPSIKQKIMMLVGLDQAKTQDRV